MVRISRDRMNMEDGRIDRPVLKDHAEIAVGSVSKVNTTDSYTIDIESGNVYNLTLNDNCTFVFNNPTGSGNACSFTLILTQDVVGGWRATWPGAVRWSGGVPPTLGFLPDDYDVFHFATFDGGATWFGSISDRKHDANLRMVSWGGTHRGRRGNNFGEDFTYSIPYTHESEPYWARIETTFANGCGIKTDGTLWTWGRGLLGVQGQNDLITRSSPTQVGSLKGWTHIIMTGYRCVARHSDGSLWAWGQNQFGQLGIGDIEHRSSPTQIGSDTDWTGTFAVGYYHTLARKSNGTLWSWGYGLDGALGHDDAIHRSSPAQVGSSTDWGMVASRGGFNSIALKANGSLWTWGWGGSGITAHNDTIHRSSPTQVGSDTDWALIDYNHAIKTNGSLWVWGNNTNGRLGLGDILPRSSPTQVGSDTNWLLSLNYAGNATARKMDGTLWAWGLNSRGAMGVSDTLERSSPMQVGALRTWSQTAPGASFTLALQQVKELQLWTWGWGASGRLGQNSTASFSSPVQVGGLVNWKEVVMSQSGAHHLAIKFDGTLWSWGYNFNGQLGKNNTADTSSPTQVGKHLDWKTASAGLLHSLAVKTDGTLWSWGFGSAGRLGHNNQIDRSSPTQMGTRVNWSKVSAGSYHSMAIKLDGTMWGWGWNAEGELGINTALNISSPAQVGNDIDWSFVSAGRYHNLALKTNGTLWSWGFGGNGELGTGNAVNRSSPTQIGSHTWKKVHAGRFHSLAIRGDGTLWSWGYNKYGELGLSHSIYRSSPSQIGTATGWVEVASGSGSSFAVRRDGTLWSWGYNGYGYLGVGDLVHRSSPVQVGTGTNWVMPGGGRFSGFGIRSV